MAEYNRLRVAAEAYADERKDPEEIAKLSGGIDLDRARRTYERCVAINPRTKQIYGYFACIPDRRIRTTPRQRRKPVDPELAAQGKGLTLVLRDLFSRHPDIEEELRVYVLTRSLCGAPPSPKVGPPETHAAFVDLCERKGIPKTEWPLAADCNGEKAIYDWYEDLRLQYPVEVARSQYGDDAAAKVAVDFNAARANRVKPPPKRAYEEVQVDAHKVDALFTVMYPTTGNQWAFVTYCRIWLVALIEIVTKAVLSTTVAYGDAVTTQDIYKLFRRALWAPDPFNLSLNDSSYRYVDGAMYPANLDELKGLSFGMVKWDRASVHISAEDQGHLHRVIGCEFTHGRIEHPMEQAVVENFFGYLAPYIHLLPTSTGSSPKDVARRNPEVMARLLKLPAALGGEILDVLARNRNAAIGSANISRVQHILELKRRGEMFISRVGGLKPPEGHLLLPGYPVEVTRTNGNKGPLGVNFQFGRYSSRELNEDALLARSTDWRGMIHPKENAQEAYFVANAVKDRVFDLDLHGAFADVVHTLEWRRAVMSERYQLKRHERLSNRRLFIGVTRAIGQRAAAGAEGAAAELNVLVNGMMDVTSGRTSPVEVPPAVSSVGDSGREQPTPKDDHVGRLLAQAVRGELTRVEEPDAQPPETVFTLAESTGAPDSSDQPEPEDTWIPEEDSVSVGQPATDERQGEAFRAGDLGERGDILIENQDRSISLGKSGPPTRGGNRFSSEDPWGMGLPT